MDLENVSKETWVRTIVLLIALVNQGLQLFGVNTLPFTGEEVANVITIILTVISAIWSWWKNNSFTTLAQEADKILKDKN
ncbi:MAG: phage holin [Eubacteriaceae bacterium]